MNFVNYTHTTVLYLTRLMSKSLIPSVLGLSFFLFPCAQTLTLFPTIASDSVIPLFSINIVTVLSQSSLSFPIYPFHILIPHVFLISIPLLILFPTRSAQLFLVSLLLVLFWHVFKYFCCMVHFLSLSCFRLASSVIPLNTETS